MGHGAVLQNVQKHPCPQSSRCQQHPLSCGNQKYIAKCLLGIKIAPLTHPFLNCSNTQLLSILSVCFQSSFLIYSFFYRALLSLYVILHSGFYVMQHGSFSTANQVSKLLLLNQFTIDYFMNNMTDNIFVHIFFFSKFCLLICTLHCLQTFSYLFCWRMGDQAQGSRMALFIGDKALLELSINSPDICVLVRLECLHIMQGVLLGKYQVPPFSHVPLSPSGPWYRKKHPGFGIRQIQVRSYSKHYQLQDLGQYSLRNLLDSYKERKYSLLDLS